MWIFCFSVFCTLTFAAAVCLAICCVKKSENIVFTPLNIVFAYVFLSGFVLLLPAYFAETSGHQFSGLKAVLFALHGTFQTFTIDSDPAIILEYMNESLGRIAPIYSSCISILFIAAPVLSFGFLVSLLKNFSSSFNLFLGRCKDLYVFSELNDRSLTLASDIRNNHKNAVIAFCDVFDSDDESIYERCGAAKKIRGLMFKQDILQLRIQRYKKNIYFFTIGESESENTDQALSLVETFGSRKNTFLYVFSMGLDSELLLSHTGKMEMVVRRVNEAQAMIYQLLFDEGSRLFDNALPDEFGGKRIHAVIVGLGSYGLEMVRALSWYCQMDGYRVMIDAYDQDPLAEERFAALCPELMDPRYNGVYVNGESQYLIRIHSGLDSRTKKFADSVMELSDATYVLVCTGDDAENIQNAVRLRMLFERCHAKPVIQAVVYRTDKKQALEGAVNMKGVPYSVSGIGDLQSMYSEKVILHSDLEQAALRSHLKYYPEETFWRFEYNYRSSIAQVIHQKARIACRIPGAEKTGDQLTAEERDGIELLEHRRWNSYTRSEGYVFSGSLDPASRNDLGKMHHNLVCFDDLTEEQKRIDSRVGTR